VWNSLKTQTSVIGLISINTSVYVVEHET